MVKHQIIQLLNIKQSIDVVKTKSNKEAIVRYLKIPQEDLLGYEYGLRKGAVFQPSYFVSYDQGHEAVVLGIRGTWVKDLKGMIQLYITNYKVNL